MLDSYLMLARRFSGERPGLELLGVEKAAVPVTVVAVDVLAQEVKALPLLDEFVLRLVKASVSNVAEIAAFLGLEQKLVDVTVADHYRQGVLSFDTGAGRMMLTGRGRRLAEDLESVRPVQRSFKVVFDRLTWSVADYESRSLMTKRTAVADGYLLLPAQRTTRIKTPDITPTAVNSILRQPGRRSSIDVLDVTDVMPSTHRYMPVDVLVYGDPDRGEVETAVVVDGDPSLEHESVLNSLGGASTLDFRVESPRSLAPFPGHLMASRVEANAGPLTEDNTHTVREVKLFDHQLILLMALDKAVDRILIATDRMTNSVVDSNFIGKLERRLRARVQVDIVLVRMDRDVGLELVKLAGRYKNRLRIHEVENFQSNVLIYDSYWVISDFPWLSFRGSDAAFRDCPGTLVTIPEEVDREFEALRSNFDVLN